MTNAISQPPFFEAISAIAPIDEALSEQLKAICLVDSPDNLIDGNTNERFFDLDRLHNPPEGQQQAYVLTQSNLVRSIATAVQAVNKAHPLTATAYLPRPRGRVGLSPYALEIARQIGMPMVQIDPRQPLLRNRLKPTLPSEAKIAILTDMTADGEEIYDATRVLWTYGMRAVSAIAIYEGSGEARRLLHSMAIPLTALVRAESFEHS